MKKVALLASILASAGLMAQDVQLVVQHVDNHGLVPGQTYRVYAQLPNSAHSLHAAFGETGTGLRIESTAPFYQHPFGGNTSVDINKAMINLAPELAYDSWLTIGKDHGDGNSLWEVGINFDQFGAGNALEVADGAWFLLPTDAQTKEGLGNLVLLAQVTTSGIASGTINLQGWDGDNKAWQARKLTFVTSNAKVFGCNEPAAANYNPQATFNNGTCEYSGSGANTGAAVDTAPASEPNRWSIFPNPVFEGQINIQFANAVDLSRSNAVVQVFDLSGKLVYSREVKAADLIGGNRVILNTDLASGSYQVNVRHGSAGQSQQIVVQR